MTYTIQISSPLGNITAASDGTSITGLWFEGQKHFAATLSEPVCDGTSVEVLLSTTNWLTRYWKGEAPSPAQLPLAPRGTAFQREVWEILLQIPYGSVMTYGQIAKIIAEKHGKPRMSSQAVGNAVARNPISILIPCHRVVGSNGTLTGYDGGIWRKEALLKLESTSNI